MHVKRVLLWVVRWAAVSDWAEKTRGIDAPEIVAGVTCHPCLDKACHYLRIKLHKVPVNSNMM